MSFGSCTTSHLLLHCTKGRSKNKKIEHSPRVGQKTYHNTEHIPQKCEKIEQKRAKGVGGGGVRMDKLHNISIMKLEHKLVYLIDAQCDTHVL